MPVADVAKALKAAASKLGKPYVWGAVGPNAFDCSGLTSWAWRQAGVEIPRTSQAQARFGTAVSIAKIQPGDLVTSNWGSGPSSHVALYVGDGRVIHAPRTGKPVMYAKLDANYRSKINAIRRVPGAKGSGIDQADWDIPGLGGAGDVLGGLNDTLMVPFNAMAEGLIATGKGLMSIGELATFLLKLALPSTWVRAVCGFLGVAILFLGLGFLVRETRGA